MNERIKQLAEQARAQYCDLGDASCFKRLGLVEAVVFKPEDLEKFAELIVQECMSYMEDGDIDFAKFMIKKHFGVEERKGWVCPKCGVDRTRRRVQKVILRQ